MKTALLAFTTMMVLGFSAKAETPDARECRLSGGQQWSVSIDSAADTSLCLFGSAAIGSLEFAGFKASHGAALSIRVFLKQTTARKPNGLCDIVGAAYKTAKDSAGNAWDLCKFPDASVIELNTLAGGLNSDQNADLVKALH